MQRGVLFTLALAFLAAGAPSIKIVRRELPTNYIMGCYSAPRFGSAESYPMILAESILEDRLFEEVRTKRSLSYAPAAGLGRLFTNYGLIYVTAVRPPKVGGGLCAASSRPLRGATRPCVC